MSDRSKSYQKAAYGGPGWQPRTRSIREEIGDLWAACGINSEYARLKAVMLHRPGPEIVAADDPNSIQMWETLDLALAQEQHDGIAQAYQAAGAAVHYIHPFSEPSPNQMFMADLMFMTPEGLILARPASTVRAGEEREAARRLADLGIPILRSVSGTGTFEGADAMWLDPQTVILGRGIRTNAEGVSQVTNILNQIGVDVIPVDLPFGSMHLMGMLRIVDRDLAIAWPNRLVHAAVEALRERGYRVEFLPDEEEALNGSPMNFVTVGPRQILMAANNPNTQRFYENLAIECHTIPVDELGKAAGAIGCLSGVLWRESV